MFMNVYVLWREGSHWVAPSRVWSNGIIFINITQTKGKAVDRAWTGGSSIYSLHITNSSHTPLCSCNYSSVYNRPIPHKSGSQSTGLFIHSMISWAFFHSAFTPRHVCFTWMQLWHRPLCPVSLSLIHTHLSSETAEVTFTSSSHRTNTLQASNHKEKSIPLFFLYIFLLWFYFFFPKNIHKIPV